VTEYLPDFVLVRGVAYRKVRRMRRRDVEEFYLRASVPPDATPGKRSKWPVTYRPHKLPEHEVVDDTRVREVAKASLIRLHELGIAS
jgi:hypothetical protein